MTVVVPCYRQAHFLPAALESVRAQSHDGAEIIVVDDGSPDDVAGVAARYPGVRLVRQRNRGLAAARNAGLAVASGRFVAFLDADDVLYPEALACGLAALRRHSECLFAAGGHTVVTSDGRVVRTHVPTADEPPYARMLRSNFIGMHGAVLYRREALEAVGGFRDELVSCEDMDVFLRLLRCGPVALHDEVIAEYRWHETNMSHESGRMFVGVLGALRAQRPFIRGNPVLEAAYAEGLAWARLVYGEPVYARLRHGLARRDVPDAARALALLLRNDAAYYVPRMLRYLNRRASGGSARGSVGPAATTGEMMVPLDEGTRGLADGVDVGEAAHAAETVVGGGRAAPSP